MPVPEPILTRMRCPQCSERVHEIEAGLLCSAGHVISTRRGYIEGGAPDATTDEDTRRTAASFGYEWTTFDGIQPEDESFWEMYFKDVQVEDYAGKVGLDAGCGKGRYTAFTARHMAALAAVDNSDAVEAAVRNLSGQDNVAVIKADLRNLPFESESFDFLCSLGVIHHLSDPEDGFRRLVRLLRPGGVVLIYVYSRATGRGPRAVGLAIASRLRTLTVRMPHRLLRGVSAPLAAVLYLGVVLPGALGGRSKLRSLERLPLATYRGKPLRSLWLDTFDRLSAPTENRYLPEEVEGWFGRAGVYVEHVREEAGLFVVGRKHVSVSPPRAAR